VAQRGGTPRLHPGQQAALLKALPVESHSCLATGREGGQRSLSVRDGHRHRQDPHCRRRHQALPPFEQCPARPVPGGSPQIGGAGQEGLRVVAIRRLSDGDLQGDPRRLAAGGDRRHDGAVAAVQQQVPAAFLADRFRPGHLRRSSSLHRRQRPSGLRLFHRLQAGPDRYAPRLPQAVRQDQPFDPRPARSRTPAAAGHLSHLRLREQPAHLPLLAAGRREGRLPHQPYGRGCPHGDN